MRRKSSRRGSRKMKSTKSMSKKRMSKKKSKTKRIRRSTIKKGVRRKGTRKRRARKRMRGGMDEETVTEPEPGARGSEAEARDAAFKAEAQKKADEAAARRQPPHELKHGFTVTGFSNPDLNVSYEAEGEFDGLPKYRETGGGGAGLYWDDPNSNWTFLADYTENKARGSSGDAYIKMDSAMALPLGVITASCLVGPDLQWQQQTVTLTGGVRERRWSF